MTYSLASELNSEARDNNFDLLPHNEHFLIGEFHPRKVIDIVVGFASAIDVASGKVIERIFSFPRRVGRFSFVVCFLPMTSRRMERLRCRIYPFL